MIGKEYKRRLETVRRSLSRTYMTPERVMDRVYGKDYDPRLVKVRAARTRYHLDRLVEMGAAEVRTFGDRTMYRKVKE